MFHWPIQVLTLWDFHVARALESWRAASGPHVRDWVEALGEVDALGGPAGERYVRREDTGHGGRVDQVVGRPGLVVVDRVLARRARTGAREPRFR